MIVIHVRSLTMKENYPPNCVISMDKTSVWSDMIRNTTVDGTGVKNKPLESTGTKGE